MTIVARGFRASVSRNALAAFLVLLAGVVWAPAAAFGQDSKSAALASELARLLDEQKLDSVAAQQADDTYVGALYFPGTQLLVVGGKYASPARMKDLLSKKDYREVYMDLSSASDQKTRVFIMDLGVNGLRFKREDNQPFDTADVAGKSWTFDGDWGRAKISEDEYRQSFTTTDERYSQMLQALISALKKTS